MDERALEKIEQELEALAHQSCLTYRPYPKQRHYHNLGSQKRFRCLMAGNQVGKTFSAGMEVSFHATGLYPDWWEGRRYDYPTKGWVGSETGEVTRDNAQRILLGEVEEWGTGTLPADRIVKIAKGRGVENAVDYLRIRHVSGGLSYIGFKTYDQGRKKWQGATLHWIWCDEEPPLDIWQEGKTRTNAGDQGRPGMMMMTLTPLQGMTTVARMFFPYPFDEEHERVQMGLKDAMRSPENPSGHYRPEDVEKIAATYPEHERRARVEGFPQLGEGAAFPVDHDTYLCNMPEVPAWWPQLGGLDFGWDHPMGASRIAWDRDADRIWVLQDMRVRQKETLVPNVASTLKRWSPLLYWAWPRDANKIGDAKSGETYKQLYAAEGLKMLGEEATWEDGGRSVEAFVFDVNNRIATDRFKVVRSCGNLREEMESYHRRNGKLVQEGEDVISSVRYAVMMKRFARTLMAPERPRIATEYDPYQIQ